ncbi:hypothetical protein EON81_27690 [bacterium]|nr:MAG: hypothetical protein EON81_27690 [bacterium]
MPLDDPIPLEFAETRALHRHAFATLASTASVLLISPFFTSHGAEVNAFTTAILTGQILVLGLWTHAAGIYARAKGYDRIARFPPLWAILVLGFVTYLLRGRPITSPMRGKTIYSIECADAFLILGLAGVGLTITLALLSNRRRRPPIDRPTTPSPWGNR